MTATVTAHDQPPTSHPGIHRHCFPPISAHHPRVLERWCRQRTRPQALHAAKPREHGTGQAADRNGPRNRTLLRNDKRSRHVVAVGGVVAGGTVAAMPYTPPDALTAVTTITDLGPARKIHGHGHVGQHADAYELAAAAVTANSDSGTTAEIAGQQLDVAHATRSVPLPTINDPETLAALADELGLRADWHEPDNSEVDAALVPGVYGFDNACSDDTEHHIVLLHDGRPIARINVATLLSWATIAYR